MITSKKKDISRWYEEVVYNSGIASPGLVKGTLFIHPRGWNIWEKIQGFINDKYRILGIKNLSFPSLIPITEIEKEKKELSGFIPELFLVSKTTDLNKKDIFLRPTSEILFSYFFKKQLSSYEQLPFLFNQWCNVYRLEKNTKAFLRNSEFYWQEAHTLHKTEEDAFKYLNKFHEIYKDLLKNFLNIDVLEGEKTVNERFKGAVSTLALEAIMPDGQALQVATSHFLGRNFSSMFDIKYTNEHNIQEHPFQLSAGSSTRLIGALILSHSDDKGLVLPFYVADVQVKILVIDKAISEESQIYLYLNKELEDYSVEWDFSDKSFGYKIKNEELIGTPFSLILGKKELSEKKILVKNRIKEEKELVDIMEIKSFLKTESKNYSAFLFKQSSNNLNNSIVEVFSLEEAKKEVLENKKIVLVPWFDDLENEEKFKSEKLGFGPRCIKEKILNSGSVKCFYSKKPATSYVYFGRSY